MMKIRKLAIVFHLLNTFGTYNLYGTDGLSPVDNNGTGTHHTVSFPRRVYLKTATQSFNRHYYFILHDNRIWYKSNEEVTGTEDDWRLFPGNGVPFGKGIVRFGDVGRITAISSDGMYLIAMSESGCFYRGYNLYNKPEKFFWTDRWGWPAAKGPGLKVDTARFTVWHVSDVFPAYVKSYTDSKGIKHSTGLGVAHIYLLNKKGFTVHYNDWWLPPDMSRRFSSPEGGAVKLINMSVSASMVFGITEHGNLYTRLYDFDVCGDDDLVTYSYFLDRKKPGIHGLPAPGWKKHAPITDGRITGIITIVQNGTTSDDRIMRVEGVAEGKTGFFEKEITDPTWKFRQTGMPLIGKLLDCSFRDTLYSRKRYTYSGYLSGSKKNILLKIRSFNPYEADATITLSLTEKGNTNGRQIGEFPFLHLYRLESETRAMDYWDDGTSARIKASILLQHYDKNKKINSDQELVRELFGKRNVIHLTGTVSRDSIVLKELGTGFLMFPVEERALFPKWELKGVGIGN
jgi:hypothetical protein